MADKQYWIYSKELYGKLSIPIVKKLAKTRITPNQITILSLLSGSISGLLFAFGYQKYLIIGAVLLHFSILLDYVDGKLAREKKMMSAFGGWLDGFVDRIVDFFIYFGLAWGAFYITGNHLIWILCSLVLGGHYLTVFTYISVRLHAYEMRASKTIATSRFLKIFAFSRTNIYLALLIFVLLNNILWYFYLISIYVWLCLLGALGFFTIKFKRYPEAKKSKEW